MKWPRWFPYPSSWLRGVVSIIWLSICAYLFWIAGSWGLLLTYLTLKIEFLAAFLGIAFTSCVLAFARLYDAMVLQPKRDRLIFNLVSKRAIWEGSLGLIFPVLACVNVWVLIFSTLDRVPSFDADRFVYYYRYEGIDEPFTIALFVTVAYLYQIECLARRYVRRRRLFRKVSGKVIATKSRSQRPKKTPATPIDPIERELNQLKQEMGLTRAKDVRKLRVAVASARGQNRRPSVRKHPKTIE